VDSAAVALAVEAVEAEPEASSSPNIVSAPRLQSAGAG